MARGVRKSALAKLQEEMKTAQEAIAQYENCLKKMKEKAKRLAEQIEVEDLKSLSGFMKDQKLSVDDLKELIMQTQNNKEQGA